MAVTYGGDFDAFENAVRAWVIAVTGLASTQVIRGNQNGPRPAAPFAEVTLTDVGQVGASPAQDQIFDSGALAGEEITLTSRAVHELTAVVRVFTVSAVGASSARAILARLPASLGLESVRDTLHTGGLTCFDAGTVSYVPAILDTKWEGRATLTARFYAEITASETTGYISSVELTDTSPVPDSVTIVDAG